jgi:hypothetical protein
VKLIPGVALLAIVAGCASQASSTRLTIQVADSTGTHVYRLPSSKAPDPATLVRIEAR